MPRPVECAHRGDRRGKSYLKLCHGMRMGQLSAGIPGLRRSPVPQQSFPVSYTGQSRRLTIFGSPAPPRQLPYGPMSVLPLHHAGYSLLRSRECFASCSGSIDTFYLGYTELQLGTTGLSPGFLLRSYP